MNRTIDPCDTQRNNLIAAALGLQQCTQTDGTEVLIPGTDKRILIGGDAYLAKMAAPAVQPREHAEAVKLVAAMRARVVGIPDAHDLLRMLLIRAADFIERGLPWTVVVPEAPASEQQTCWGCKKPYTLEQRAEADGDCPHCGVEIELDEGAAS